MRAILRTLLVLSLGLLSAAPAAVLSASTKTTVSRHKTVGDYRLTLVVGPAEDVSMRGRGEHPMGGKPATCSMPMHMSEAFDFADKAKNCNHHVELHVLNIRSRKVVTGARVSIVMRNTTKHSVATVPVGVMQGQGGRTDLHYGNNIYAQTGHYAVQVTVNSVRTSFSIQLA